MNPTWLYTFGSVLIISLVSLIGVVALSLSTRVLGTLMIYLVSFAAGTLFGSAFIHLLPEAFTNGSDPTLVSLLIIGGLMSFFIVEKFFRWRHCHIPTSEKHLHPIVPMNIVGDGMHNFIDGVLIAVTYTVSIPLGIAATIAVLFHEIPQEIGDFSVLVHGGLTVKKALWLNFLSSLMAVVGAGAALIFGTHMEGIIQWLIPITAGGFIYIAGSDLIPEMHHSTDVRKSFIQMVMMLLGVAALTGLKIWG